MSGASAGSLLLGRVVAITDGDTLVLLDEANQQHKIRLAGIDAPEMGQPFSQVSRRHLSSLAFQHLANADCPKVDKYRRLVCVVWVDGGDVNLAQIQAGLAWHYKKYESEQTVQDRNAYTNAEENARAASRGLWSQAEPIPPWEWRAWRTRSPR